MEYQHQDFYKNFQKYRNKKMDQNIKNENKQISKTGNISNDINSKNNIKTCAIPTIPAISTIPLNKNTIQTAFLVNGIMTNTHLKNLNPKIISQFLTNPNINIKSQILTTIPKSIISKDHQKETKSNSQVKVENKMSQTKSNLQIKVENKMSQTKSDKDYFNSILQNYNLKSIFTKNRQFRQEQQLQQTKTSDNQLNQDGDEINQQQKKNNIQNYSLPNLGNTCFMNSDIQLLASSHQFVKKVVATQFQNQNILKILKEIFLLFNQTEDKKSNSMKRKKQLLQKLLNIIASKDDNFRYKRQQDAIQFLSLLINTINQQDQSFKNFFQLKYYTKCQNKECLTKKSQFEDIIIFWNELKCEKCKQTKVLCLKSFPDVILVSCQNMKQYDSYLIAQDQNNKNSNYFLSSRVLHSGSEEFGHYTAIRKSNGNNSKQIVCNDQIIYQASENKNNGKCKILLYQRCIQSSQENKKKIQNQKLNLTKHNNILVIRIFDWLFRFVNSLLSVLTNKKLQSINLPKIILTSLGMIPKL